MLSGSQLTVQNQAPNSDVHAKYTGWWYKYMGSYRVFDVPKRNCPLGYNSQLRYYDADDARVLAAEN